MYNKHQYYKSNDKKVLHKVRNHWITISLSLLMMIGGGAAASQVNANASKIQSKPTIVKPTTNNNITNSAYKLHHKILNHALVNANNHTSHPHYTEARRSSHHSLSLRNHFKRAHHHKILKRIANHRHNRRKSYKKHKFIKHYYHKHAHKHYRRARRHTKGKYLVGNRYGQAADFSGVSKDGILKDVNPSDYSSGHYHIIGHKNLFGYNFDHIKNSDEKLWVFANEMSNHKHGRVNGKRDLKAFNSTVMHHDYSNSDIDTINNIKRQYHYLEKYENNNKVNTYNRLVEYREHVVDWINFYRSTLYGLQPVTENADFDNKAQNGAETNNDPEDMIMGDPNTKNASNPSDVAIYFTDTDDADHDGEPGHRTSVLNPRATEVGIGVKGGRDTLYFRFGLNNDPDQFYASVVSYPNSNVFPINYANQGHEDYWGVAFSNPSDLAPNSIPANYQHIIINNPQVTVYDDTANKPVNVWDVHNDGSLYNKGISNYNSAIYYKVDTHQLHINHQYSITVSGDNLPNGSYTYKTQLFNLNDY